MTETYREKTDRREKEIDAGLTTEQRAVAHALWRSVAGEHCMGPILDFGPRSQDFIDRLRELGYELHSIHR